MKLQNLLLPLGVVAIAALAFSAYKVAFAPLPEGFPSPTANGEIEVKRYPAYRAATVRRTGELSQAANRAFSPLFRHISANDISIAYLHDFGTSDVHFGTPTSNHPKWIYTDR